MIPEVIYIYIYIYIYIHHRQNLTDLLVTINFNSDKINSILQRFNFFENVVILFCHKRGPLHLIFNICVYFSVGPFSQLKLR